MWWVVPFDGDLVDEDEIEGTMSMRYISMNPDIKEIPIQA